MWPFSKKTPSADVQSLTESIRVLSSQLARLREDHEDLHERFVSLRGRVYHVGLHKTGLQEHDKPAPVPASLDSVTERSRKLTQAGFTPGKPFPHR